MLRIEYTNSNKIDNGIPISNVKSIDYTPYRPIATFIRDSLCV